MLVCVGDEYFELQRLQSCDFDPTRRADWWYRRWLGRG